MRRTQFSAFILSFVLLSLLVMRQSAYAEDSMDTQVTVAPTEGKESITETKKQGKEIPERIATIRAQVEAQKEKVKEQRDKMKTEIEASRSAMHDEVKNRINEMKDARKKQIVTRMQTKLTDINTKQTNRLAEIVKKMTSFLDGYQKQIDEAKKPDTDTTAFDTAMTQARDAVAAAQAAVNAQAAKMYMIDVQTDATAHADAGTTLNQFRADITSVIKLVNTARLAVVKAHTEYRKLLITLGVKTKEPTHTGTPPVSPTEVQETPVVTVTPEPTL